MSVNFFNLKTGSQGHEEVRVPRPDGGSHEEVHPGDLPDRGRRLRQREEAAPEVRHPDPERH